MSEIQRALALMGVRMTEAQVRSLLAEGLFNRARNHATFRGCQSDMLLLSSSLSPLSPLSLALSRSLSLSASLILSLAHPPLPPPLSCLSVSPAPAPPHSPFSLSRVRACSPPPPPPSLQMRPQVREMVKEVDTANKVTIGLALNPKP